MPEPSIDGDLLNRIHEQMLSHAGPENAVTSGELADALGIDDTEAQPKTREAIRILVEEREVPIAASNRGYYLIQTDEQFQNYRENLESRIRGIRERVDMTASAWSGANGGEA